MNDFKLPKKRGGVKMDFDAVRIDIEADNMVDLPDGSNDTGHISFPLSNFTCSAKRYDKQLLLSQLRSFSDGLRRHDARWVNVFVKCADFEEMSICASFDMNELEGRDRIAFHTAFIRELKRCIYMAYMSGSVDKWHREMGEAACDESELNAYKPRQSVLNKIKRIALAKYRKLTNQRPPEEVGFIFNTN